jgi:hypothetical protein
MKQGGIHTGCYESQAGVLPVDHQSKKFIKYPTVIKFRVNKPLTFRRTGSSGATPANRILQIRTE